MFAQPVPRSDPTATKTHAEDNTHSRPYNSNQVDIKEKPQTKEKTVGLTQPLGTACAGKSLQAAPTFSQQACDNKSRRRYSPENEKCR